MKDLLMQTASEMSVSEAKHYGAKEPARSTPCQPIDYGGRVPTCNWHECGLILPGV